ncbi:AsmA-like C-terminal region-containing protein [Pelagibacteraceae bacterium]|nr:AsmA-like C-terminal region-containing protein [Pelagibacteraceae bacterium]
MRKIIYTFALFFFIILITLLITLTTFGIETNYFNNIIIKKISQSNSNVNLKFNTIKFKLDIKLLSLFLETNNPFIEYRSISIPIKNIKVYTNFISLIKSDPKIKKINLVFNQIDIKELKKLSVTFKPSNLTSFVKNKIKKGKIDSKLEIYLDEDNLLDNFIARGSVSNLKAQIINNINLEKTNFNFFADKTDILLKNISSETGPVEIKEGDLKLKLSSEITLESNFKTNIKYDSNSETYKNSIKDFKFAENLTSLEAKLYNNFFINFDETYKVKKYYYKNNGKIIKANFNLKEPLDNSFLNEKINQISFIDSEIKNNFNLKNKTTNIIGKYLINNDKPSLFNLESIIGDDSLKLKIETDYSKPLKLDVINYIKPKNSIANILINLEKQKDILIIKNISLKEKANLIHAEDIKFKKNKFLSLKKINVKTNKDGKKNNDFSVSYGKKIKIKGTSFDASYLPKFLSQKKSSNNFLSISKDVEIDFANIIAPLSENLKNFKLIGKIEKGKFTKILSKGDFGSNNFIDITMKKDENNKKRYLEIYSDLTRPLLTEYSFFKGLTGGKLFYSSIIDGDNYNSKLKIENFNLINAPAMVKLLSLADLSGLADLAEGEGLSFDVLEIKMEKKENILILSEILALGPSISLLMDGYTSPEVTSLRGTLVPAKTLNKMISKIPVLGNIIIPKEVGEGLFGISFKMKGPKGKIKTTINPIRTITPRFIQKIIDRDRKPK